MTPVWFWPALAVLAVVAATFFVLYGHLAVRAPAATARLYRRHFADRRQERLFLAAVGFFITFVLVRALTHAIRAGIGPFRDVARGELHIHHLVWGILLLLAVGLCWLAQLGTGENGASRKFSQLTAILYGLAAALTLDEFALWLRLQDVYWTREGRESVEAVLLFGGLLAVLGGGARFFRALVHESLALLTRR